MAFEVDFLPVGAGERGGDAIAVRYGNLSGPREQQTVIIIDGGTQESGNALVQHLQRHYRTEIVDYAILTHPDADHASGLSVVLEKADVRCLLMHKPWEHSDGLRGLWDRDGRWVGNNVDATLKRNLDDARELERAASRRHIPVYEPFAGIHTPDDSLRFLGPTQSYYEALLPDFLKSPTPGVIGWYRAVVAEGRRWIRETLDPSTESLDDTGVTSARNNSSAITFLQVGGTAFLFTGDAGIPALMCAAEWATANQIDLASLAFLQVPHHGSRRNLGPGVLARIKAPIAYVSAPPEGDPKHPSRRVVNALIRRNTKVYTTQGKNLLRHSTDAPPRGWGKADPKPFFNEVEEVED